MIMTNLPFVAPMLLLIGVWNFFSFYDFFFQNFCVFFSNFLSFFQIFFDFFFIF